MAAFDEQANFSLVVHQPVPPVPRDFELPLLGNGTFSLSHAQGPVVFNAFDDSSGFSRSLWQNPTSIDGLLLRAVKGPLPEPPTAHFVFVSHAGTARGAKRDVASLQSLFEDRLQVVNASEEHRRGWRAKLHFVSEPSSSQPFVKSAFGVWPTAANLARVHWSNRTSSAIPRLDARYDWLGWNFHSWFGPTPTSVVSIGDACSPPSVNVTHQIALAINTTRCDYFDQVRTAQQANASALVVWAAEGQPLVDMRCLSAAECDDQSIGLPATMVSHEDGAAIAAALVDGEEVSLSFASVQARGTDFAIDREGRLVQSWGGSGLGAGTTDGNPGDLSAKLYPSMAFLGWVARGLDFEESLAKRLDGEAAGATRTVQIFISEPIRPPTGNCYGDLPWGCGPSAVVAVPRLEATSRWELVLDLGCRGDDDVNCPQWDHVPI